VDYLRWLWWPVILYLFWAMAFVCDVYFVRTIDVITERFCIPDDVAGATLMALGCNGPELALNTIAIFHPSNIGVGAVVGGEVFNVLVIIGTALLATPQEYMPLKLGSFAFFRDITFYALSVALLYWTLQDGEVSPGDIAMLLSGAVIYIMFVIFSHQISRFFSYDLGEGARELMRSASQGLANSRLGLFSPFSSENPTSIDASGGVSNSLDEELDPELLEFWHQASSCKDPCEGGVLAVRADVRNRLMDRGHRVESRYMWLRGDALLVSTVVAPDTDPRRLGRARHCIVYDHDRHARDNHWHHGGLVNQPIFLSEQETPKGAMSWTPPHRHCQLLSPQPQYLSFRDHCSMMGQRKSGARARSHCRCRRRSSCLVSETRLGRSSLWRTSFIASSWKTRHSSTCMSTSMTRIF